MPESEQRKWRNKTDARLARLSRAAITDLVWERGAARGVGMPFEILDEVNSLAHDKDNIIEDGSELVTLVCRLARRSPTLRAVMCHSPPPAPAPESSSSSSSSSSWVPDAFTGLQRVIGYLLYVRLYYACMTDTNTPGGTPTVDKANGKSTRPAMPIAAALTASTQFSTFINQVVMHDNHGVKDFGRSKMSKQGSPLEQSCFAAAGSTTHDDVIAFLSGCEPVRHVAETLSAARKVTVVVPRLSPAAGKPIAATHTTSGDMSSSSSAQPPPPPHIFDFSDMDCAGICTASRKVKAWCYKHRVVDSEGAPMSKKAVTVSRDAVLETIEDDDFPDGAIKRLKELNVIVEACK